MPHVVDILRVLEWVVRDTAAQASTSGALGVFPLGVESFPLTYAAGVASSLCAHTSERPSALVVLALAAGPGSRVQRQLYSLLCTLLKALEVVRTAVAGGCAMIL
jgi:hypothetical protein